MPYTKIFETEVNYWDRELSLNGDYPEDMKKRLTPERMKEIFPECLLPLMAKKEKPKILDVGSGPVSMLNYVSHNNLAELTAADPLAEEYYKLLLKYGYSVKYPMVEIPGEYLSCKLQENYFDISWIHNALDHSQNPAEVVKEMIKVTKYGGYIVIAGWEYEGSYNSFYGLHQHNLFFNNNGFFCQTVMNKETGETFLSVNITKDLPVKIHSSKITEINGRKWMELIFKKQCPFFQDKRTEENKNFFDALVNSWLSVYWNPNFPIWGGYALQANLRGQEAVEIVKKHTEIKDKKFLDIGCAYGGFLVAFYRAGAKEVEGFDINAGFLRLARENARDIGINPAIYQKDALDKPEEAHDEFDIITCNDVIEHVENPEILIENIYRLLAPGGIVYLEIPNKNYAGFIEKDGHYSLFGITLFNKEQAKEYFQKVFPGDKYTVGEYLSLQKYQQLFNKAGFKTVILEETFKDYNVGSVTSYLHFIEEHKEENIAKLPEELRRPMRLKVNKYLREAKKLLSENGTDFTLKYGVPFWKILLKKEKADDNTGN